MKRTRWTRIALALQFDDYSDNLLESSLARTIYDYDYVYAMAMSIANGYGYAYGYALMGNSVGRGTRVLNKNS